MPILLKNTAITDCSHQRKADVLIDGGRIAAIFDCGVEPPHCCIIDCTGLVLMPSFVDLHAHFRDPGQTQKESIESGCRAAAHGGYTFVNLMPNTSPVCSDMETLRYVREKARKAGICGVHQAVSITKKFDGKTLSHLDKIDESVLWLSDDGNGVNDIETIYRAMLLAKAKGIGLMLHEEERLLTPIDSYLAEDIPTARDVKLAALTECKTHFCHVSTVGAMDAVIAAKSLCANITCEVTPHHIALNDSTPGNVAPPLRGEAHRAYLIECIKKGFVDAIATDHAPHTAEDKASGANGFTGLDLSFAACYTSLVKSGHISISALSRLMSYNPAKLMGLGDYLIKEGAAANLTLADIHTPFIAGEGHILSKSKNSPMLGKTLYGIIKLTIKEGEIVYENFN
ncbi:MAG: dihydroorotase [Oscillospiraceae bacterium]|nr:dihydroorotase [Oscillospiraceae bacterium]